MASIFALKTKVEALDPELLVYHTMQACEGDLGDINREQMFDGKTNQGTDITPSYYNDPYFKSPQEAAAYSDWKDRITPNPRRTKGTPNLFINGYFYSTQEVQVLGDKIIFNSSFSGANDISNKFKNIYGLGGRYKSLFLKDYYTPVFKENVLEKIGLLMK